MKRRAASFAEPENYSRAAMESPTFWAMQIVLSWYEGSFRCYQCHGEVHVVDRYGTLLDLEGDKVDG